MVEPPVDRLGVMTLVGERVTAGVTEHVRMRLQFEARGDGHVGSYTYERPGRSASNVYRFRLALADAQALDRTRDYLQHFAVSTSMFAFAAATADHRAVTAIRTQAREPVERVGELIHRQRVLHRHRHRKRRADQVAHAVFLMPPGPAYRG